MDDYSVTQELTVSQRRSDDPQGPTKTCIFIKIGIRHTCTFRKLERRFQLSQLACRGEFPFCDRGSAGRARVV
jgi:hypothetical protein